MRGIKKREKKRNLFPISDFHLAKISPQLIFSTNVECAREMIYLVNIFLKLLFQATAINTYVQ